MEAGLPAVFSPLTAFALGPPPDAEHESLIVFSQGLCPNARLALSEPGAWASTVLVAGASGFGPEARAFVASRGVGLCDTGAAAERGALVRLVGPVLGYLAALEIVEQLAPGSLADRVSIPDLLEQTLSESEREFAELPEAAFSGPFWVLTAGCDPVTRDNLRLKLSEGLLQPTAPVEDLLSFSHGPFQQTLGAPATLFLLEDGGNPIPEDWIVRWQKLLEDHHLGIRLRARNPDPLSILEHEVMLGAFVVQGLEAADMDPSRWPGQGLDAPLYEIHEPAPEASEDQTPSPQADARIRARKLDELTWPEIERLQAEGVDTVVLGLGSTEQHGPHLPFATDTWIADALADRLCARLPETLRLPSVSLGCASEHMAFPGTLSLRAETLEALISDLLASAAQHGFRRAFLFSAHGGNVELLRQAGARFGHRAPGLDVHCFVDHHGLSSRLREVSKSFGVSVEASGHHAGELEASVLAALAPRSLRRDRAEPGFMEPDPDTHALFYPSLRDHAPNGTVGDPSGASAARASAYLDAWVEVLSEAYRSSAGS